jgi:hypothetical protein
MRFVEDGEALGQCTALPSLALQADVLLCLRCQKLLDICSQHCNRVDLSSREASRRSAQRPKVLGLTDTMASLAGYGGLRTLPV